MGYGIRGTLGYHEEGSKGKDDTGKETFKSEYDTAAKARLFVEGDMVLIRIPSLVRTHGMVRRGFSLV